MDRDLERAVYIQHIDPEYKQEYIDAHDDVPDEVTEAMVEGTAKSFDLYIRENTAVAIVEAEDLDTYVNAVTDNPAVEEWERHVAQFKQYGVDVDAPQDKQIPFMERIWTLSTDSS